jgi:beta-lactamase superfamily II metal-dependent hydrolase
LADEIQTVKNEKELIDLWIISHIHDDHIGGAVAYIKAIKDGEFDDVVQSWFYNPPRKSLNNIKTTDSKFISEAKSITQGDTIAKYLTSINKLPVIDITSEIIFVDIFGLKINILSPDVSRLNSLRIKYPIESQKPFEKNEIESISKAKAAPKYDYHIPLMQFNLEKWQEDDSVENGSSISVLTEYQDKRVLWLADANPNTIVSTLKNLGYSKNNPLICDWVKVTHHGSRGNNSSELYEMIRCENYLISANGENLHCLPTKECLARILRNEKRTLSSEYKFHFTYDNQLLRSMFDVDGNDIYKELNFTMHFPKGISKMINV